MATGFYLLDHPNNVQQYGNPRRGGETPSGVIVIHTAESVADLVGEDYSAESVARYCTTRDTYGAYHRLVDSDTTIRMVPFGYETWHCTKTNPHSIGISMAVQAGKWKTYPADFVTRVLRNAARATAEAIRALDEHWNVTTPVRHITGSQAIAQVPGLVAHGETDPTRRTDPGADFDWPRFMAMVREELDTNEEDDMTPAQEAKLDRILALVDDKVIDGPVGVPEEQDRLTLAAAIRRLLIEQRRAFADILNELRK